MKPAAIPIQPRAVKLSEKSLVQLLEHEGLNVESQGPNHVVAQWPARITQVAREPRCSVVFTRKPDGVWRGAYLESEAGSRGWDLKDTVAQFRDLLHVGIWVRGHAPKQARIA